MNTGNAAKTPLGPSLSRIAYQSINTAFEKVGRRLPCSVKEVNGAIVTVKFEITDPVLVLPEITIPIAGSEYVRLPIQVGCKGWTEAADAYLGGVSGQGGGVADLTPQPNLSGLVFSPIGNADWFSVNGSVLTLYGPGGVTLMDQGQTTEFQLTPGQISMSAGGHNITISSAGVVIDGIVFGFHKHLDVMTGGGESGGPTN